MNLGDAIQLFLAARTGIVSEKTLRINQQYLDSLHSLFELEVERVTIENLRGWRRGLVEKDEKYGGAGKRPLEVGKLSPHTIHGHIRVVRQFFKWLHEEGYIPSNPTRRLEFVKLPQIPPKPVEELDLQKLLAAAETSGMRERNLAFLHFLASTGCRLSGALNLKLGDVDLVRATAFVVEKGEKVRPVYLTPTALEHLRAWLVVRQEIAAFPGDSAAFPGDSAAFPGDSAAFPGDSAAKDGQLSDYVFVSENGTRWSVGAVYACFDRLARRSGVTGRKNPHSFRHRLARNLLKNGASLGQVSRILGHADIRVTDQFYGVFSQEELRECHAKFAEASNRVV